MLPGRYKRQAIKPWRQTWHRAAKTNPFFPRTSNHEFYLAQIPDS